MRSTLPNPAISSASSAPRTPGIPLVSAERHREFEQRGMFFTDVLFSVDELEPVRDECRRVYREAAGGDGVELHQRLRPFLPRVHEASPVVAAFLRHPVFVALGRELIGPDVDQAWNQACLKLPDAGELTTFPFHQDSKFAELEKMEHAFTCFVALGPLGVENGTLHFAAGAHDRELAHAWNPRANWWECAVDGLEVVPGTLEPGAMVVYHRMTPHGSPPNRAETMREALLVGFAPPNVRLVETGERFGDQRPLLRGGVPVHDP